MARQEDKIIGRRLKSSYISTVVSITLVLFVLGLLGLVILHTRHLSDHFRESISISLFLEEGASESQIQGLRSDLDQMEAVNETTYVSSDEAAEDLMEELGEDFVEFLGYNPLTASISVSLKAAYANPDSLTVFEAGLQDYAVITDIDYQQSLIHLVHDNVRRISIALLAFSVLLLIIAFALINNTIRLSVFSKRFLIKSMQLVGATQRFIRRPFIITGVLQGIVGAMVTIILLTGAMYVGQRQIPELTFFPGIRELAVLFAGVLLLGIIISYISTFFAVRKYLKIKTDFLYYY